MTYLQSILLGAVQGLTEFLPVSSSGHLVLARHWLGIDDIPVLYDILLHMATLLAILIVFRSRVIEILRSLSRWVRRSGIESDRENLRLFLVICLASVCTAATGLAASEVYERLLLSPGWVAVFFLCTAAILVASHFFHGKKDYRAIGWREAVITGAAQGIGVFPGISRSGITISASLAAGMERRRAGEYAFLISIPAILGALGLKIRDFEVMTVAPAVVATGMLVSFAVGLASLFLLLRLIRQGRLYLFSFYLVPVAVATLVLV